MNSYSKKVEEQLNELLEKTYDSEKGFKTAAENVDNVALKTYFKNKAQERYDFGHELKSELRSFKKDIDKGGSLTGSAHRAWMDLRALFSSDDEESMLEEAIRGEKSALKEYSEVLNKANLPPSTKSLLLLQKNKIEDGLSRIKTLEHLS